MYVLGDEAFLIASAGDSVRRGIHLFQNKIK